MDKLPLRPRLGVNVDHVATIRQARGTRYPDPVTMAAIAESAGADQITVHLREDRRHVQDRDVRLLRETVQTRLNLEMAATAEMADIARAVRPDMVTLVPERRQEQTTEGGLDVVGQEAQLAKYLDDLRPFGGEISLFIDPRSDQLAASARLGVDIVELHTGDYCAERRDFPTTAAYDQHVAAELDKLKYAANVADSMGMKVAAGHGLDTKNVLRVASIPEIVEFNIGHSIVARSIVIGFEAAVREMIEALEAGRRRFMEG